MESNFQKKYFKYKSKYLKLKSSLNQKGGTAGTGAQVQPAPQAQAVQQAQPVQPVQPTEPQVNDIVNFPMVKQTAIDFQIKGSRITGTVILDKISANKFLF